MEKQRSGRRRRLLMCFRPVRIEGGSAAGRVIAIDSEAEGEEEKMVIPHILTHGTEKLKGSSEDSRVASEGGLPKGAKLRRKFCRMVKAVLFETALVRKVRRRKDRQSNLSESGSLKSERTPDSEPLSRASSQRQGNGTSLSRWSVIDPSSLTADSISSSCASSQREGAISVFESKQADPSPRKCLFSVFESKQVDATMASKERYSSNYGLCLMVLCLLILVVWGRTCAIFCTSTCLFLVPPRVKRVESLRRCVDSPEQKRRVVMEGLLRRNRSWVSKTAAFERL
ncbi:hypothetical protein NMG60_11002300 [Bertholletia excelsa]